MKNLILVLVLIIFISPSVWGNESDLNIESYNIVSLYNTQELSFKLNIISVESSFHNCYNQRPKSEDISIMTRNFSNGFCDTTTFEREKNMFIGIELSKKDSKNQFTVSLQGGFNFGIRNVKRPDGTQKIRVHANLKGKYDWGFVTGEYKAVFRLVSPGSTPYKHSNEMFFDNQTTLFWNDIKQEGLILNKDIYIGIEFSF